MKKKLQITAWVTALILIFIAPAKGQTFWGMTSDNNVYGGGAIFSYNVQSGTYKEEFAFKPSPVYEAINAFEESPGVYIGVCNRSQADGIYHDNTTGNAIYRYNSLKNTTEIVAVLPYYFMHWIAGSKPGASDIIYFKGNLIGMMGYSDDTMALISYSVAKKELKKMAVFNIQSWPGVGKTAYQSRQCYFSVANDTTILFSLVKIQQTGSSETQSLGRDFFAYNPETGKTGVLFNVPATRKVIPRGAFVRTADNRLLGPEGDDIMEIHLADSSYTFLQPFKNGESKYILDGNLFPATDTTVVGLHSYGSASYLFEYDFKNDNLVKNYSLWDKTYFSAFVQRGDSLYFAVNFTGHFPKIMVYKPGGDDPKNAFELTQYVQNPLQYLISTSDTASILAVAHGFAKYFRQKHVYVNLVRFAGIGNYYSYKDGATPQSDLLLASDGNLYGLATNGGRGNYNHGDGVLFEMDLQTGKFMVLKNFTGENGGFGDKNRYGTHFSKGQNNLVEYNGKLYGTTYTNGDYVGKHLGPGYGTIFTYDILKNYDNFHKIYDFNDSVDAQAGRLPMSGLTLGSNGKLYGTTSWGGTSLNGHGVLYEIDPAKNDTFRVVLKIPDTALQAVDNLVEGENGKMYGLATNAEFNPNFREVKWAIREYDVEKGTMKDIFVSDPADAEYNFSQFIYRDKKLYGVVARASDAGSGYLFAFDLATGQMTQKVIFPANGKNGSWPQANLMKSTAGTLWGMTKEGGEEGYGVIYAFDPVKGTLANHYAFDGKHGKTPLYTCLVETKGDDTPVEETKSLQIKAYPNPTTDVVKFIFDSPKTQQVQYTIFDAAGRMLQQASARVSGYVILNLAGFQPGAYFIRLTAGGQTYSKTIIRK
jgi:uncharacterized repeat protein (TIGR03803 family)